MMRIFLIVFFLLILVLSLSAPCPATASNPPSDDIKKAAKEGINVFLKDKRIGGLHHFGFMSQVDIDNAELGEGFQIFTIHPDKLLNGAVFQDMQSLATPTSQWLFLLYSGKKANALLTVDLVDGKWIPVSIGASELAKVLSNILEVWPASAGYQLRFVRIYQAQSDIIELSLDGKVIGIIPLTSQLSVVTGATTEAFNPRNLHDPKDVISGLRTVVKQNIQIVK